MTELFEVKNKQMFISDSACIYHESKPDKCVVCKEQTGKRSKCEEKDVECNCCNDCRKNCYLAR